jgi:hypothetical protein
MMRHLVLAAALAASFAAPVDASVLFTFQRISDTDAMIRASGSPDLVPGVDGNYGDLFFDGLLTDASSGSPDGAVNKLSGDFAFGTGFFGVFDDQLGVLEGDMIPGPVHVFEDDTMATGSALLRAVDTSNTPGSIIWRQVGATGDVVATFRPNGGQPSVQTIGTWEIVAPIPLPAAAWLLLGGVGALGAFARMRRVA